MNRKKRIISILIAVCMVITLMPTMAWGASTVQAGYLDENGYSQTAPNAVSITQSYFDTNAALASGWYVVTEDVTTDRRIVTEGDVHLILQGSPRRQAKTTLNTTGGIQVKSGSLHIYAQTENEDYMGSLIAAANSSNAGIGSNNNETANAGSVIINGGKITAAGGTFAAGIGSGNGASFGAVTINGGMITATSQDVGGSTCGAGIGSSPSGSCGNITLKNCTVTAIGGASSVGIGYVAELSDSRTITIENSVVTASASYGTGIGQVFGDNKPGLVVQSSVVDAKSLNYSGLQFTASIIFNGDELLDPGDYVAPTRSFTIQAGKTLTIPTGGSFTVKEGVTMTNYGTIVNEGTLIISPAAAGYDQGVIQNKGTLTNKGVLTNDGILSNSGTFENSGTVNGEHTYKVTLYTVGRDIFSGLTSYTCGMGAALPGKDAVKRDDYTFDGWYENQDFTGSPVTSILPTDTGNKTYYAKWKGRTYPLTLDTQGGTIESGNLTEYEYGVVTILPMQVTRTGYYFAGWFDADGNKVMSVGAGETGARSYTAKWSREGYEITYILNGGVNHVGNPFAYTVNNPTITLFAPAREGFTFDGWYDNDGNKVTQIPKGSTGDITLTARWIDKVPPTGEITIGENHWTAFTEKLSFNLFFKNAQSVAITGADNGGRVSIAYLLSDSELTAEELKTKAFTDYTNAFALDQDGAYIIYAKLTDAAGNTSYINSNGIVLDRTAPLISGIENGKTYCETQTVTVTDAYLQTAALDGKTVILTEGQFKLRAAKAAQTITATDKAGNQTTVTVTVNSGHTYQWKDGKGTCSVCGHAYTSGGSGGSGGAGGGAALPGAGPETKPNGDKVTTSTTTDPEAGTVIEKVTTEKTDGTVIETVTVTDRDGKRELSRTVTIDSPVTGRISIDIKKNSEGTVIEAVARITKEGTKGKDGTKSLLSSTQITQAKELLQDAGIEPEELLIEITVTDKTGKKAYTVTAKERDLIPGTTLYVVAVGKNGKQTLVNAKSYRVSKNGTVTLTLPGGKDYRLITKAEKTALVKEIKASIAAAWKTKTIQKGRTWKMAFKKTLDMQNVRSIQYKTGNKSIAPVNKSGKVTAKKKGTAVICAVVTLKDGSRKTVKTTVKVINKTKK